MADNEKGFTIKDRRAFSEEAAETNKDADQPADSDSETTEQASSREDSEPFSQMPAINFPTFLISLNASAMVHLGLMEDPATGEKTKNLPMAKQTIDILSMLEEKTKGNLSDDEEQMLKNIIYDLRINFVRAKD